MAKTTPKPIRYNTAEWKAIMDLQRRTFPQLSVSEIQRRSVRWAVPKFLSGEIPVSETVLIRPRGYTKRRSKKKQRA